MISRIHLQEFKAHRSTTLDLGQFTVLVGDNASGKTSVLDALSLLADLDPNPLDALKGDRAPEDLYRRGASGPMAFALKGTTEGVSWKTTTELKFILSEPPGRFQLSLLGHRGNEKLEAGAEGSTAAGGGASGPHTWAAMGRTLGKVGFYRFRPDRIAAAAYSEQPKPVVEADGSNVAVALSALKLGDDEAFDRVQEAMQQLIPSLERIKFKKATVQQLGRAITGDKIYFDFKGARDVPAHNASHGTLVVLGLLSVLYGEKRPNVLLLDELDHSLHPRAQMELVRLVKQLLKQDAFRDVQIISTTHSPYTLDELDPADVRAFALREDGTVATKPLSAHPDAAKTKGTLKAGQLWSLDSEREWILGSKAA